MAEKDKFILPELRENLELIDGGRNEDGSPQYIINDPIRAHFYQIGWLEFEILKRWSLGDAQKIIADMAANTTLECELDDIKSFSIFLINNELSVNTDAALLTKKQEAKKESFWKWILKNYLFLRIKLINPDKLLDYLSPKTEFLFKPSITKIILITSLFGMFLILREWELFFESFKNYLSLKGITIMFITIAFSKLIHEFAHALAAKRYGCKVPGMGVAFILLFPLLWTDVTDSWRLKEHNKRAIIDAAGAVSELMLAAIASLLWAFSPEGATKDAFHILASTTWIMSLAVNLNPFMRFDGYYLLSDISNTPNLQNRSFIMGKWWIREKLFAFNDKKPESDKKNWMISYGIGTWIYRFFLFLGIALLVYEFFFKALGLFLMIIEIWWFILKPVTNEFKVWYERKNDIMKSKNKPYLIIILLCLLGFLAVPWKSSITSPAFLHADLEIPIIANIEGKISARNVSNAQQVKKGEILFVIESLATENDFRKAKSRYEAVKTASFGYSVSDPSMSELMLSELKTAKEELDSVSKKIDSAKITSPIDGVIFDIPDYIKKSSYISSKEPLGIVTTNSIPVVNAFLNESEIDKIKDNAEASFYDSTTGQKIYDLELKFISDSAVHFLPFYELAEKYGGSIKATEENGNLIPDQALYRAEFKITSDHGKISRAKTGYIRVEAERHSIISSFAKKFAGIFIRESNW